MSLGIFSTSTASKAGVVEPGMPKVEVQSYKECINDSGKSNQSLTGHVKSDKT